MTWKPMQFATRANVASATKRAERSRFASVLDFLTKALTAIGEGPENFTDDALRQVYAASSALESMSERPASVDRALAALVEVLERGNVAPRDELAAWTAARRFDLEWGEPKGFRAVADTLAFVAVQEALGVAKKTYRWVPKERA